MDWITTASLRELRDDDLWSFISAAQPIHKSVFLSPYQLIDLNTIPDETLRETYYLFSVAALATKHIRNMDLVSLVETMIDLLKRLKVEGLDDYVHLTLSYIFDEGYITRILAVLQRASQVF